MSPERSEDGTERRSSEGVQRKREECGECRGRKCEGTAAGAARLHLARCHETKEGEGEDGREAGMNAAAGSSLGFYR